MNTGHRVTIHGNDPRALYLNGWTWHINRSSQHPNARRFTWLMRGYYRRGRTFKCVAVTR